MFQQSDPNSVNGSVRQQQPSQVPFRQEEIVADLERLFDQLIIEKQGQPKGNTIDKTTLLAMMLYLNLDQTEAQFYNYVQKALQQDQDMTITKDRFKTLFLDPQINMQDLKSEELAQVFSVFDLNHKGSFTAEDFILMYRQTTEYHDLQEPQKQQIESRIRKDFEIISPEHKEITPIEFYKIINAPQN